MSTNTQVRPAHQSSSPLPGARPNDSVGAAISTAPLDCQSTLDWAQPNHPDQADSAGSRFPEKSTAVDSHWDNPYIPRAGSTPLDAELRVHQEIFKALPASSSSSLCAKSTTSSDDTSSRSSQYDVPDDGSTRMFQLDKELPSSDDSLLDNSSVFESTLDELDDPSDDILSRLFQDRVGQTSSEESLYEDSSVYDDSSVFELVLGQLDDLPVPTQAVDRNRPIEFVTLAYEDIFLIQKELVSSARFRRQSEAEAPVFDHPTETLSPSRIQSYQHSLVSHQPRSNLVISPSFVSAVESHSSRSSQDPGFLSPRSSALQQRLDQAKAAARIRSSCSGVTPPQPSNKTLSFEGTLLRENRNLHNQLLSPSSSDGPDVLCFPLTPPMYPIARSPEVGQSYIPLSVASADHDTFRSDSVIGQSTQTCPRNFNLRTRRPIVTSILFQDVEAQACAANAALRKTRTVDAEGQSDFQKTLPRKKSISTAHIGAPKLVSTSAFLPGLQLDARVREVEDWRAPTAQSKGILKGGFKLKLNKKKPPETRSNRQNANNTSAHDQSPHIKLVPSNPNLRQDVCRPTFNSTSLYAGDSAIVSSTQPQRRGSLDHQPGSPTSPKHTLALNSFRKLVNTVTAFKLNHVSGNPIHSASTVSDVAPHGHQLSHPIPREHGIGHTDTVYEDALSSPNVTTGHDLADTSAGLVARQQGNNHPYTLGPIGTPEVRDSQEYQRPTHHNSIF